MKKLKKYFLCTALMFLVLVITGCQENKKPENVATAMVKKLSNNDYKNICNLFYHEGYCSDDSFKKLMEEEELNIKGNKKIKLMSVGEVTKDSNDHDAVDVKISIDDDKIFTLHTIKVENKWYVYDQDFVGSKNVKIIVPEGTKVTLDGKEISKDYYNESMKSVEYENYHSYAGKIEISAPIDTYIIPNPIKGALIVKFDYDNKNIIEAVGYNSSYIDVGEDAYDYYTEDEEYVYDFYSKNIPSGKTDDKLLNAFLKAYTNSIINSLNELKSFDNIKSNYSSNSLQLIAKSTYDEQLSKMYDSNKKLTTSVRYYDLTASSFNVEEVKEYSNDTIAVSWYYRVEGESKRMEYYDDKELVLSYSKTVNETLILKKNGDSYEIVDGLLGMAGV